MNLLLVSLGPIQDFIASARRCQDLWFGSWLLSDLARETAATFARELPGASPLIFPASAEAREDEERPSVANKILVRVPAGGDPARLAAAGERAMRERLATLRRRAFDRVRDPDGWFHREVAEKQVDELIEYLWVSVPLPEESAYRRARARAEALLAARKQTRLWGQPGWRPGPGVPKSALDGQRESVIDERAYDAVLAGRLRPDVLRERYRVKPAERLCGVGLLKRLGEDPELDLGARRPTFHSSSHMAASPLFARIARFGEEARAAVAGYLGVLEELGVRTRDFTIDPGARRTARVRDLRDPASSAIEAPRVLPAGDGARGYDGELLFRDRLPSILEECGAGGGEGGAAARKAARALDGLFEALGHDGVPCPYYAVLQADGDRMGRLLDALGSLDAHRRVSEALVRFAERAGEVVVEEGGSLVYAGGDDVLALLPLHAALACAERLHAEFAKALEEPSRGARDESGAPIRPTLSVGLGIAHHHEPMADARVLARRAESLAKEGGRDGLGIVLSLRSGATLECSGRFGEERSLAGRIALWCRLLDLEEAPTSLVYRIEEETAVFQARGAGVAPSHGRGEMAHVVEALVRRALSRRRERSQEAVEPEVLSLVRERLAVGGDPLAAVERLSAEMQVARVFLDAVRDAFGKRERREERAEGARAS